MKKENKIEKLKNRILKKIKYSSTSDNCETYVGIQIPELLDFTIKEAQKDFQEKIEKLKATILLTPSPKDKKGFIEVNQNLQTSTPNIFACGDVIGPPLLAHKAAHQALAIVDFMVNGKEVSHTPVPGAVF